MIRIFKKKKIFFVGFFILTFLLCLGIFDLCNRTVQNAATTPEPKKDFIHYVEFNVNFESLDRALSLDIKGNKENKPVNWVDLLSLEAARTGGKFTSSSPKHLDKDAEKLQNGSSVSELSEGLSYYSYYRKAYGAVLDGLVGNFEEEVPDESASNGKRWEQKYGLSAYSPIAKGFPYSEFDDFGVSRTYGYRRQHLGHDMMGQIGTPIIAVESGTVEALGWNQYGGWRIGIRSFDKQRYYYYAHLRQNYPYRSDLKVGSSVKAGDVIGYLGHTGYSTKENVNNITQPHLHFGLELVFDESQKESDNEIWVDVYPLCRLLSRHQSLVAKIPNTKDYQRVYDFQNTENP
ncbi:MAG: M23 family metallopeptidase [Oscillospiraceae bacterium]|jgi:murein DD-endopeptidase MepM/ murein hydrolase activator NlpD